MSYPNSGILFRNDKKQPGDKLPDYRGTAEVDGKAWEISAWIKESKDKPGKKFMSISFKPPYKKAQGQPVQQEISTYANRYEH